MIRPLGGGGRLSTVHSAMQRCRSPAQPSPAQQDQRRSFPFISSQCSSHHANLHDARHDHLAGPRVCPGEGVPCSCRQQPDWRADERCKAPLERPCVERGAHRCREYRAAHGPPDTVAWSADRDVLLRRRRFSAAARRRPDGARPEAMTAAQAPEHPSRLNYTRQRHVPLSATTPPLGSTHAVRGGVRQKSGDCRRGPVHGADGACRCAPGSGLRGGGHAPR